MVMRDIMTARVVTVEMDDRLEVVKEIFDTMNFHHLLVVDEHKKLSGVVSDRDLLRALSPYVGSAAETERIRRYRGRQPAPRPSYFVHSHRRR